MNTFLIVCAFVLKVGGVVSTALFLKYKRLWIAVIGSIAIFSSGFFNNFIGRQSKVIYILWVALWVVFFVLLVRGYILVKEIINKRKEQKGEGDD